MSASVLTHAGEGTWLALVGLGTLVLAGLPGLLTTVFLIGLPLAGRRLADEAERLQKRAAVSEEIAAPVRAEASVP